MIMENKRYIKVYDKYLSKRIGKAEKDYLFLYLSYIIWTMVRFVRMDKVINVNFNAPFGALVTFLTNYIFQDV